MLEAAGLHVKRGWVKIRAVTVASGSFVHAKKCDIRATVPAAACSSGSIKLFVATAGPLASRNGISTTSPSTGAGKYRLQAADSGGRKLFHHRGVEAE
jgi:hypothetical protein